MTRRIWILLAAATLIAAGCGASGDDDAAPESEPVAAATEGDEPETTEAGDTEPEDTEPEAPEPETVESAAPDASPFVLAFGDLSAVALPDGEPGEVSILWSAETIDRTGSVRMVVRNNTSDDIGRIDVTGTARDSAGDLIGSGSSQGFEPAFVAPGEIAFGYVYFDYDLAESEGFEFSFEVDAENADSSFASNIPVTVTEINNTGSQLVGAVVNEGDDDVSGPIGVAALCFDDAGAVIDNVSSFLEQDELASGATGSFSIDLFDRPCANGLIASSGFGF